MFRVHQGRHRHPLARRWFGYTIAATTRCTLFANGAHRGYRW